MDQALIAKLRAETRGVQNVMHFNNAGSSLAPDAVHNCVVNYLERERQIGGYEAKAEHAQEFDAFYASMASLIGAKPSEIAFIENATRAWDMAFYALPFQKGDEIITVEAEYASNYLAYLQAAKRHGVVIKVAPCDDTGQVDVNQLQKLISRKTKLISMTHVPSQGGLINPAAEVGKVARKHGVLYLLDACQSVGQLDINVNDIGCDMMSATGRKFLRGPRGTGFLYVRESLAQTLEPPMIDLHAAEWIGPETYTITSGAKRFENWECYYAGKLGLAEAARYAMGIGMKTIEARALTLTSTLREQLAIIPGITLTDRGSRKSAIVTFHSSTISPEELQGALKMRNINTSVSTAAYARLDLGKRGFKSVLRASPHYYNTYEEIELFCKAVAEITRA
jgi:cysteine desulfurase / selenocysteine lyase